MLSLRCKSPVDYRLCTQTVTVYHKDGDTYTRAVYDRAFLDFKKTQSVDKVGVHESNSFLLVFRAKSRLFSRKTRYISAQARKSPPAKRGRSLSLPKCRGWWLWSM